MEKRAVKIKESMRQEALEYHRYPEPGKISITPTTSLTTQQELSLAYSPGVAAPCLEIEKEPLSVFDYTSKGNLVAVVSNGTAVLGLGDIGALASKPVMEGKSVLFKKFSGIDSIDIEVDEKDIDKFVDTVARLEPTFGGINLEDIKAPECFEIERKLKERMNIPVFHDDQHGTAIISSAALTNWLYIRGRKITDIKVVVNGAGAAAIACMNLMVSLGLPKDNITVCDSKGVVYKGRKEGMNPQKEEYAQDTNARTLSDALEGADVFLGLSRAAVLDREDVAKMVEAPLIMALANPVPEIMPEDAKAVQPDAVICTGRSDYPNQVNNVLCFPFLFRGALDVGATAINEEMKHACVKAIAELARREAPAEVASVYSDEDLEFGENYIIPKPFDQRLIIDLPMAVAKAAMESGVATRPIKDFEEYRQKLEHFHTQSAILMRPIFNKAKSNVKRVVYTEGEEFQVLHAIQMVVDDKIARPVIVGRRAVVESRIEKLHLRIKEGRDYDLVDPESDPRYRDYCDTYYDVMKRKGVTPAVAHMVVRNNTTIIGCLMVYKGDADALVCGTVGSFSYHMKHVANIIGLKPGVETAAAMRAIILPQGTFFVCDTHVNPDPSVCQISEMTLMAVEEVKRFGMVPKVALVSHSNFGTHKEGSADKMRMVCIDIKQRMPELEIDGEMHADTALSQEIRDKLMPDSSLKGAANLLVMPNIESANISFNMLKVLSDGATIGPMLLGVSKPAHILTPAITPRGIFNVTALACVQAQVHEQEEQGR